MTNETNEASEQPKTDREIQTEKARILYFSKKPGEGPTAARAHLEEKISTRIHVAAIMDKFAAELANDEPTIGRELDTQDKAKGLANIEYNSNTQDGIRNARTILTKAGFNPGQILSIFDEFKLEQLRNP